MKFLKFSFTFFLIYIGTFGENEDYQKYAMFAQNAERAKATQPIKTELPLKLTKNTRIALIEIPSWSDFGNFGHFEALLQQGFTSNINNEILHGLPMKLIHNPTVILADTNQHLTAMKADLIIAAFGFNESFSGIEKIPDFKIRLQAYLSTLKAAAYNGDSAPQIVMVSPIANENVEGVDAGAMNNKRLLAYTSALRDICAKEEVGFIDCYTPISKSMESSQRKLTINDARMTLLSATCQNSI